MKSENKLNQYSIYLLIFAIAFIIWNVIEAMIILKTYE